MTIARGSNAYNQGIAHISHAAGGKPFCGRRGHISVAVQDIGNWPRLCVRCEAKLADMRAREALKSPLTVNIDDVIATIEASRAACA